MYAKNFFVRALMSSLCSISVVTVSLFGQPEGYYDRGYNYVEEDQGNYSSSESQNTGYLIAGAAVAGAIGGAIVASCNKRGHHHHHCSSSSDSSSESSESGIPGPQGPAGPSGPAGTFPTFPEDLVFNLTAQVNFTVGVGTGSYVFYVVEPDGTTVSNPAAVVTGTGAQSIAGTVTIPSPAKLGNYVAGVDLLVDSTSTLITPDPNNTNWTVTRPSLGTTIIFKPFTILETDVLAAGDEAQQTADFGYAPSNASPVPQ